MRSLLAGLVATARLPDQRNATVQILEPRIQYGLWPAALRTTGDSLQLSAERSAMIDPFAPYRTEALILLVGTNPLPNYVAARLLARDRAKIYLLHSTPTSPVAERMALRLNREQPQLEILRYGLPETDGPAISRKVAEIVQTLLRSTPNITLGLNYTGGTKPMAAYSYSAVSKQAPNAVFSYLDASTLSMCIDHKANPIQRLSVGRKVELQVRDIVDLHGYSVESSMRQPIHEMISSAIYNAHLSVDGAKRWREWLTRSGDILDLSALSQIPELESILSAFSQVCNGSPTDAGVARVLGFERLTSCRKYFAGGWLEDKALAAIEKASAAISLSDWAYDVKITADERRGFQLDAAATIGYQLFAISCRAARERGPAKEHFFEVYTRAAQLGGDEARCALLSLYDRPEELQTELSQDWDAAGRIRVFGRKHLPDLATHFANWFRTANLEAS